VLPVGADVVAVVALGGAVGSVARWAIEAAWPARPGRLPWATLVINVSGCALLGALVVLVLAVSPPSRYLRPALGTGVLGGFTTFSTAMLESHALLGRGAVLVAGSYLLVSVALGLIGVWLGTVVARGLLRLTPRAPQG